MRVENELKDAMIFLHKNLAETFMAGLGKHLLIDGPFLKALQEGREPSGISPELYEILYQPLWREYGGDMKYTRTLALASLDKDMERREFYRELAEKGWYPASISETICYLSERPLGSTAIGAILCLGTIIRNEELKERRLLKKNTRDPELLPFYPTTPLNANYKIVVVKRKEEKRQVK